MNDPKGYYATLEVKPSACADEIKKAYRRKSLETHPDTSRGDTTAKFQKVSEAYDILGDPEERKKYDRGLSRINSDFGNGMAEHFAQGEGIPQDIFEFFKSASFGGTSPFGDIGNAHIFHMDGAGNMSFQQTLNRPTPIVKTIQITLSQAFSGCKLPIEIERWVCDGSIKQKEKETIYIDIPAGVDDNEIIVLKNKGNSLSDTNKGDIKIFIKVLNNTDLERKGLDLTYRKIISLKEALCGFTFDMEYLDERTFKIDNNNGTVISPGFKKVIPGLGMIRGEHKGNLIIDFTVIFPKRLTKEQIDKIKEHI
jgi:DnaJ-class molecular chaperone